MSDDLFESFEAFDASVMDAVNATSTYKIKNIGINQNPLEVIIGKENVEKRSYLKIHSFAHISRLGEESIHAEDEALEEDPDNRVETGPSPGYDEASKAKNYARLMNVLKSVNSKESLDSISKENIKTTTTQQKRRSSRSLSSSESDLSKKRPKLSEKTNLREIGGGEINQIFKSDSTSKELNITSGRSNSGNEYSKSQEREINAKDVKIDEKEVYLYIQKSFYLKKKESISVEIPISIGHLENISEELAVRLHFSHRYDKKYSRSKNHDEWVLNYEPEQTPTNGLVRCNFTNLTQTEVKVPRNMKIGRANFTIPSSEKLIKKTSTKEDKLNCEPAKANVFNESKIAKEGKKSHDGFSKDHEGAQLNKQKSGSKDISSINTSLKIESEERVQRPGCSRQPHTGTGQETAVEAKGRIIQSTRSEPDQKKEIQPEARTVYYDANSEYSGMKNLQTTSEQDLELRRAIQDQPSKANPKSHKTDSTDETDTVQESEFNVNNFSSLKMLPQFTKFAKLFCNFKNSKKEEIQIDICDDCIIDCETIGLSDSEEMFDIMKADWNDTFTEDDWINMLCDKYSLIGSGLVSNIKDIVETYMFVVGQAIMEEKQAENNEKLVQKAKNLENEDIAGNKEGLTFAMRIEGNSPVMKEADQKEKDPSDDEDQLKERTMNEIQDEISANIELKEVKQMEMASSKKFNWSSKIIGELDEMSMQVTEEIEANEYLIHSSNNMEEEWLFNNESRTDEEMKKDTPERVACSKLNKDNLKEKSNLNFDNQINFDQNRDGQLNEWNVKRDEGLSTMKAEYIFEDLETSLGTESKTDYLKESSKEIKLGTCPQNQKHLRKETKDVEDNYLQDILEENSIEFSEKWKQEKGCILHGIGTVIELYANGLGLIKCDNENVIFGTDMKYIETGDSIHFDAIEESKGEFERLFENQKIIRFWATDVWNSNKPSKRAIDSSIDVEEVFLDLLSHIIEFKMTHESFISTEEHDEGQKEPSVSIKEKNGDCPHFKDLGPFCKDIKNCPRDCGAWHEISEDVQALLGREIGSFCPKFAQYKCKMGNKCLKNHVMFSDLADAAKRGMQVRRNHCHKCNVRKKLEIPCQLLDMTYNSSPGFCRFKATTVGGCTNKKCKYGHRIPRHMDLNFCWVYMRGDCSKPNCSDPHLSYSKVSQKFTQLHRTMSKNCEKCSEMRDIPLIEMDSPYSRMSITVDCISDDLEQSQQETKREVEFSPSKPAAMKIRMSISNSMDSKSLETRHASTESQDSWTRDFSELEARLKFNVNQKSRLNSPGGGLIRISRPNLQESQDDELEGGCKERLYSRSKSPVAIGNRQIQREHSRGRSPPNRYIMERRETRYIERQHSRSRTPPSKHDTGLRGRRHKKRYSSRSRSPLTCYYEDSRESRQTNKSSSRRYEMDTTRGRNVQEKYLRSSSPSVSSKMERIHRQRSHTRSESPLILSRSISLEKEVLHSREVTFQSTDEENRRPSTLERKEAIICTHFLKGKCSYGDKCFKVHLQPEEIECVGDEGREKQRDLRQRLIRGNR